MKHLTLFLLLCFLTPIMAEESTLRHWVLNNGYFFKASYEKFDQGNVVLNLEDGKSQRIPVGNIGVADRYYLHTAHEIPIEDMDSGNYLTAERDIKIKDSDFKKVPNFTLKGEGYEAVMGAVVTPHFLFLHDKGAKVKEYTEGLEKVVFSHAYRMPNYLDMRSEKRSTFLFIQDFDLYKELGKALVDNLRKEGKASPRSINQLEVDWLQYAGHRNFTLPKELAEEYGASTNANIQFAGKKQKDRRGQVVGFINRYWGWYPHRQHVHGGIPRSRTEKFSTNRQNNSNLCYTYALAGSSAMRFWESLNIGGGGALDQSGFIGYGFYGDPQKWGEVLSDKVKSGTVIPDFERFYVTPSNNSEIIEADEFRDYWLQVSALGRFLDQDLGHQIGVCRLYEYMHKNRKTPSKEEMPALLGYSSLEELNTALHEFMLNKNTRIKY